MATVPALVVNDGAGASPFKQMPAADTFPNTNIPGGLVISPSQVTSDQDNYSPTGWADCEIVRVSFDTGFRAITGLTAWTNGKIKTFVNIGATSGYFPSEHPDSTAANRIAGESDHILEGYGTISFWYDATSGLARVLESTFNPHLIHLSGRGQVWISPPGSTNQSDQPFIGLTQASSGTNSNEAPTATLPGAWGLDNGGNAAGASTVYFAKNLAGIAFFGSAHIVCGFTLSIDTLSTSAQRYTAQASITASPNTATLNINNSFGFRYSDNINSGVWQFFSRDNAAGETTVTTGIAAATGVVLRGMLMIDKARAEQRVFLTDGTTVFQAANTGNIPNAVLCGFRGLLIKSVGTQTRLAKFVISGFHVTT